MSEFDIIPNGRGRTVGVVVTQNYRCMQSTSEMHTSRRFRLLAVNLAKPMLRKVLNRIPCKRLSAIK